MRNLKFESIASIAVEIDERRGTPNRGLLPVNSTADFLRPETASCLRMLSNGETTWRFVSFDCEFYLCGKVVQHGMPNQP